jgi:hypothetical protein
MGTYSDNATRTYSVPGSGLCVDVTISSEMIGIHPEIYDTDKTVSEFALTRNQTIYTFRPEAYKRFWKWLSTSKEPSFIEHPERMRAALNFALKIYRSKYGEIFN